MSNREVIIKTFHGDPMASPDVMSLLFGIAPEQITAQLQDHLSIPAAWIQAGRRRASEAAAHTGSRELVDFLRYWGAREGVTIMVEVAG